MPERMTGEDIKAGTFLGVSVELKNRCFRHKLRNTGAGEDCWLGYVDLNTSGQQLEYVVTVKNPSPPGT